MDPIDFYLRKNKKISLLLLAHAHAKLSMVMLQQGFITYEDALKTICFYANQSPIATEVVVHAGILYEASFLPSVTKKGQIAHKLSPDTIGNEIALLERVFNILGGRTGGIDCPSIEELRREASAALGHDFFSASHVPRNPEGHFHSYYSDNQQQFGQEVSSRVPAELLSRVPDNIDLADDYRSGMLTRIECEKSEPIVRLLAQVRKVGMDILFPQITHDKVGNSVQIRCLPTHSTQTFKSPDFGLHFRCNSIRCNSCPSRAD